MALSLIWAIIIPFVLIIVGYMTQLDFDPHPIKITVPKSEGPLAYNDDLSSAEKLFEGKIWGPESLAVYKGNIYTGVGNGDIVRITKDNKMEVVARIGKKCEGHWQSKLCGRPLGTRFDKNGKLFVADAVYGIHSVDVSTGIVSPLLTTYRTIEDRPMVFPDDLTIDDNGVIYITDASGKWDIDHSLYCSGEFENSGRVIRFDPKTHEATVIMKDIYFPNGIQISENGDFLLVVELLKSRVLRYYLKGSKKGQQDVFIDNLPGLPDNIRPSSRGGFWVALGMARNETHPLFTDKLINYPFILKYLTKFIYSVGTTVNHIAQLLPYPSFREHAHLIKSGLFGTKLSNTPAMIIELSSDGKILRNLYSENKILFPSEVLEYNNHLYIGSFINNYLGKLKLVTEKVKVLPKTTN